MGGREGGTKNNTCIHVMYMYNKGKVREKDGGRENGYIRKCDVHTHTHITSPVFLLYITLVPSKPSNSTKLAYNKYNNNTIKCIMCTHTMNKCTKLAILKLN